MQIHERIWVVGGGDNSFGISARLDCTVYLVDGASELALIDSGAGVDYDLILANIRKAGFDIGQIKKLFLTHGHCDHSGGATHIAQECGLEVFGSSLASKFLKDKSGDYVSIRPAIEGGIYPTGYIYNPVDVIPLSNNDTIHFGDLTLRIIELPGHSDDSCGYLLEHNSKKLMFSGDLAFPKAKISMQKVWDCRWQPYLESLRKVDAMKLDALLTGHQAFCMNGAHRIFERLLSPGCGMLHNI